ncbi:MAG: hypothetical protein QMD08_00010 [Actinomycetota bacterium]|nr:hypothetical protein [Actinomycetota bacterium]
MRRWTTLFLVLLLLAFFSIPATAMTFKSGENVVTIPAEKVIDDDLYIGGGTVNIDGTVNGDVIAAGGMVTVSGTVNGDVMVAGGMVTISGKVSDDVRIAGGNLTLDGEIGGDALVAGGNLDISSNSRIAGDLLLGVGNVRLAGSVGRDVRGGTGSMEITGDVGRNVKIGCDSLTLASGSRVGGDLTYTSQQKAKIQEGAKVSGRIAHKLPPVPEKKVEKPAGLAILAAITGRIFAFFLSLIAVAIVGGIIVSVAPKKSLLVAETIASVPWKSLGLGFVLLIVVPIASFIISITIVGLSVGLILLFAYILAIYLSKVFAGLLVGERILAYIRKGAKTHILWSLFLGIVVLSILGAIPILGFFIRLAYILFALGAMWIVLNKAFSEAKEKKLL